MFDKVEVQYMKRGLYGHYLQDDVAFRFSLSAKLGI